MKYNSVLLLLVIITCMFIHSSCKPMIYADLVLINGKIVTVDSNFSIAEAIAVSNDKIVAVGTNRQIKKFIGRIS